MSNKPRTIEAEHITRKDANGNPKRKVFSTRVWDKLPKIKVWIDGEKVEADKQGWVPVDSKKGAPAPEPLKGGKNAPKKKGAGTDESGGDDKE